MNTTTERKISGQYLHVEITDYDDGPYARVRIQTVNGSQLLATHDLPIVRSALIILRDELAKTLEWMDSIDGRERR